MLREKSCGALVVRRDEEDGKQYLLMIRHKLGGHRSFPKGHMEPGETESQTAEREILEETGLRKIARLSCFHDSFFAFSDAEHGDICVVYKRKEGSYGLIVPEH